MARPESEYEIETICVKSLFAKNGIDKICKCPNCTGRGNKQPLKKSIEFPELLKFLEKERV